MLRPTGATQPRSPCPDLIGKRDLSPGEDVSFGGNEPRVNAISSCGAARNRGGAGGASSVGIAERVLRPARRDCAAAPDGEALQIGEVVVRYPLVNVAASPVRFESEPRGMFEACRDLDRRGFELLAVYHSHPTSRAVPSRTDLEWNLSSRVVTFIVSLATEPPQLRAWWLTGNEYMAAEWEEMP